MEDNTLATGGRKRLHLGDPGDAEPHGYLLDPSMGGAGPRFTVATSDPTVAIVGGGGDYRLAMGATVGSAGLLINAGSTGSSRVTAGAFDTLPGL